MALVTYLFGAGASAKALPVVNEMYDNIGSLRAELNAISMEDKNSLKELTDDLDWLAEKANPTNNTTIDTYAKQLYLQREGDEYKKLRAALSVYFVLKQIKPECLDRRYCDFWTNLITIDETSERINTMLPKDLLLLSWNYDSQLEKAYHRVLNKHFQSYCAKNRKHTWGNKNPFLIKLNGSADFLNEDDRKQRLSMLYKWSTPKTVEEVVSAYQTKKNHSILSFAWDPEYYSDKNETSPTILKAQKKSKDTETLVIIGYSFPYFNREIDRVVAGAGNMEQLKKVYFQAPQKDVENIKMRFQAVRDTKDIELISITDLDQFFIPPEL